VLDRGIPPRTIIAAAVAILLSLEVGAQLAFRVLEGRWIFSSAQLSEPRMFERHPYLVGTPIPGFDSTFAGIHISHNSRGTRGPEFDVRKKPGVRRIVTIGASTTYSTGVSDGETWPELLGKALGSRYEVINLGVPGYSTVEGLIQTALEISDLAPDIAIYYEGWADVRNMHIAALEPDYSNYHPRQLYQTLRLSPDPPRGASALLYYLRLALVRTGQQDPMGQYSISSTPDGLTDKIDQRALALYGRNLRSIVALDRSMGIVPVFIPQLLNFAVLTADTPYGWNPYIRDKDLGVAMTAYNERMKEVAAEQRVDFIEDVIRGGFTASDFLDQGHFNTTGSTKFAGIVAAYIQRQPHLSAGGAAVDPVMQAGLDALYKRRDYRTAIALFQRILDGNPTHYGATYQLAAALDLAGRRAEALKLWVAFRRMAEAIGDKASAEIARNRIER
jgi:lysophospholipase L1-like esterase